MKFVVYNKVTGKITRTGHCQACTFDHQAGEGEFVLEAVANDVRQKVVDGFDDGGQPINPRVVDKTKLEIERDSPKTKPKPFLKKQAKITNEQYESLLKRIDKLEEKK